jgi:DNA-binding NtrC family response regulator
MSESAQFAGPMVSTRSVLIVEDEQNIRDTLAELFEVETTRTLAVGTLDDARSELGRREFDLIVTDIRLGGKRDGGLQIMAAAGLLSPDATVIVLTAYPDDDNRFASLRLGATYFLEKPVDLITIASLAARHGVATALFPLPSVSGEEHAHTA